MFEVAQAIVRNWEEWPGGDAPSAGVYIVFRLKAPSLLKRFKPSCRLFKRRPTAAVTVDVEGKTRKTQVSEEKTEMVFASSQIDTMALFQIAGPGWNVWRGDKVIMVAEVWRMMMAGRDQKVRKFQGHFSVGTVGEVILADTLAYSKKESLYIERSHVAVEVRASWTRPFVLDNARPSPCDLRVLYFRNHPISRQKRQQSERGGDGKMFSPAASDGSCGSTSAASDGRSSAAGSDMDQDDGCSSRDDWNVGFVGVWSSAWPCEGDYLEGRHEVVPLMEAEFRKDCIVMFNTLFPRTLSSTFQDLRDYALAASNPRLGWKPFEDGAGVGGDQSRRRSADEAFTFQTSVSSPEDIAGRTPRRQVDNLRPMSPERTLPEGSEVPAQSTGSGTGLPAMLVGHGSTSKSLHVLKSMNTSFGLGRFESSEIFDEYSPRINFLKRLFICFAFFGLKYSAEGNAAACHDLWPYPLASIISHGTRILIKLVDVEGMEFMNFLFFGKPNFDYWRETGTVWPMMHRLAATHAVVLEEGRLVEKKLEALNVGDTVQNIADGYNKKHMGLNMPIGGVGNPSPLGEKFVVGFTGEVVRKPEAPSKKKATGSRQVVRGPDYSRSNTLSFLLGEGQQAVLASDASPTAAGSVSPATGRHGGILLPTAGDEDSAPPERNHTGNIKLTASFLGAADSSESLKLESVTPGRRRDVFNELGTMKNMSNRSRPELGSMKNMSSTSASDVDKKQSLASLLQPTHSTSIGNRTTVTTDSPIRRAESPDAEEIASAGTAAEAKTLLDATHTFSVSSPAPPDAVRSVSAGPFTSKQTSGKAVTMAAEPSSPNPQSEGFDSPAPHRNRRNSITAAFTTARGGSVATNVNEYTPIAGVQCGHMYCRMDNFGDHQGEDEAYLDSESTAELWNLQMFTEIGPTQKAIIEAHHRLLRNIERIRSRPRLASILAVEGRQRVAKGNTRDLSSVHMYETWHGRRIRRVRSQPPLHRNEEDPSIPELKWLQVCFRMPVAVELGAPPTVSSLRMLLQLHNPMYMGLFGNRHFKSVDELYDELRQDRRSLVKHHLGLRMVTQRMLLKIRWKGHYLVCRCDEPQRGGGTSSKQLDWSKQAGHRQDNKILFPAVTLRHSESWQVRAAQWAYRHFAIPSNAVKDSLHGDITHAIQETVSPPHDYPGLSTCVRTHIVNWEVRGKAAHHFQWFDFMRSTTMDLHYSSMQYTSMQSSTLGFRTRRSLSSSDRTVLSAGRSAFGLDKADKKLSPQDFCTVPLSTGSTDSGFPEEEDRLLRWTWLHHNASNGKQVYMLLDERSQVLFSELPEAELWAKSFAKKEGVVPLPPSPEALLLLLKEFLPEKAIDNRLVGIKELWGSILLKRCHLLVRQGHIFNVEEHVVIRMRGQHRQGWYTLAQDFSDHTHGEDWLALPQQRKSKVDSWRESANAWLQEFFGKKKKVDASSWSMEYYYLAQDGREEVTVSSMPTLRRWHLVTVILRDEILRVPLFGTWGLNENLQPGSARAAGAWKWVPDQDIKQVKHSELFEREDAQRKSNISSVLIGLEGSGPQQKGAFGQHHSATGKSGKVSAVGSRKWSAYRKNSALEVPSEYGSMRMSITKKTFAEFMDYCSTINLHDPIDDLIPDHRRLDRAEIHRHHMEREFFKLILTSNGREAREVLESVVRERASGHGMRF
mmetsp:Transcript_52503/g.122862  ORF Transcript_52503/g.122862 Transcript_52503/m.122862 type:complete len:1673 (-) Transcript_52503:73-5091(-)